MLFHDTIYHNLAYGDLSRPREAVYEAAKMADLHDAILTWPNGYDTQASNRGGIRASGADELSGQVRNLVYGWITLAYES